MSTNSYESNYDLSFTYRLLLSYVQGFYSELGVSRSMEIAWSMAKSIQECQVLPLLTNLSAVNQALDLMGIPEATRTKEHPDIIDQMSQRLPFLSEKSFASGEDSVLLHELLDEAGLIRSDGLGRTLTLSARLKAGVDELVAWRALALERAEVAANSSSVPTELIVINPTRLLALPEIVSGLIDEVMPTTAFDPVATARVEDILDRLDAIATDHVNLSNQVNNLHRLITVRLGKDQELRARIELGFSAIVAKIELLECDHEEATATNETRHYENRQQIASLQRQISGLVNAVNEPRVDAAERLLREALDSEEAVETLSKINQHAVTIAEPWRSSTQSDLKAVMRVWVESEFDDDVKDYIIELLIELYSDAEILRAVEKYEKEIVPGPFYPPSYSHLQAVVKVFIGAEGDRVEVLLKVLCEFYTNLYGTNVILSAIEHCNDRDAVPMPILR